MRHLNVRPTLATRLRWRIQDVIDRHVRSLPNDPRATLDNLPRFEQLLCDEIEALLTEAHINLDTTQ